MAQLNNDDSAENIGYQKFLWGISHLLTLGLVSRFQYNYCRYSETTATPPDLQELRQLAESVDQRIYALRGFHAQLLAVHETPAEAEAAVLLLRQQVYDTLERLHHRLLYLDADLIEPHIPLLDNQLRTWNPNRDDDFPLHTLEEQWQQLKARLLALPLPESR